ncbi:MULTISPECIES: 2-hydroxyacid dehydrogenase [Bacillus]|uniref:2-hydroxyacid dehydrogenase n=1 Tax=Bacillus TaxID=1386 RepID=UPI000BB8D7FD|nr:MULTISPECIES: D-glycerate dehydrogenase [Bacillus]
MEKYKVFITRKLPDNIVSMLEHVAQVKMWEHDDIPVPYEVLKKESETSDALLTMLSDRVDKELLTSSKKLKIVANLAVGYDNIDLVTAQELGITICNTPDILTDTTADLTFSLLLATARRIVEANEYVKSGKWQSWSPFLLAGSDVHHKTIGIVGMGDIGEAVAKRATGFDMNILYYNRNRKIEAEQKLGAQYKSFEDLLKESDFVVCLTPLTNETRQMFGKEQFGLMKKSAIFVNVGRGQTVDEQALIEALETGSIAGAGLDVFYEEPISAEHPLLAFPQVTAIPHIGSASVETRSAMIALCCENIKAVLEGKKVNSVLPK